MKAVRNWLRSWPDKKYVDEVVIKTRYGDSVGDSVGDSYGDSYDDSYGDSYDDYY